MADPFSIVAGVFGLSAIAVKVIISLSGYVDSVRGAKAEVQALSVDISTMHAILGELKIQMDEYPDAEANLASDSKNAVKRVLERCKTTLLGLERMVDKAQIVATESGMERMVKTVRWKFKDDEIKRFKELLREDKANLKMIMQILSRHQDNKAMSMLEEISQRMNRWDQERAGVKETFAVVESGDARASLTIHDRRGEPLVESSEVPNNTRVPQRPDLFSPREREMLERVGSSSWSVRSFNLIVDQSQPSQDSITQSFPLEAGKEGIRLKLNRAKMTKLSLTFEKDLLFQIRRWCVDIGTPNFGLNHFMSLELNVLTCYAPLWIIKPASVAPSTSSSPSSSSSAGIESVEIYFPSPADSPDPYIRGITLKFDGETDCSEFTELFLLLQREQIFCWKGVASLFSFATRVDVDDEAQLLRAAFDEAYGLSIEEDLIAKMKWVAWLGEPPTPATPAAPVPTPTVTPTPAASAPTVTPRPPSPSFFEEFWDWLTTPSSDIPSGGQRYRRGPTRHPRYRRR